MFISRRGINKGRRRNDVKVPMTATYITLHSNSLPPLHWGVPWTGMHFWPSEIFADSPNPSASYISILHLQWIFIKSIPPHWRFEGGCNPNVKWGCTSAVYLTFGQLGYTPARILSSVVMGYRHSTSVLGSLVAYQLFSFW